MNTTLAMFSYRTREGCYVYGHVANTEDGAQEHITLATTAPPVLIADRARAGVDQGGKVWP